jgi:glioma pathogenesis-related protein 2
VFVVCNYDPPGNFIGSFTENVSPIGGFPEIPKIQIEDVSECNGDANVFSEFSNLILKHHNEYRRKHGSVDLK